MIRPKMETPVEKAGFAVVILFWVLALAALSQAAHGQDLKPATQQKPMSVQKISAKPQTATTQKQAKQTSPEEQATTRLIVISIPDRQLALIVDGEVVKVYPIAVGKESTPSPEGEFTIITRTEDPTYYHEGKVIPPGKNNPLGTRWMGLSLKGYGIHGTNAPKSIGKAASHGCIRMAKKNLEELFTLVKVGDAVTIRSERDELVAQVFGNNNTDVQVASATASTPASEGGNE
ncbi:MAG: L,D-transpeptidase [Candidatus Angelobacter sp. Gp1-AA117]|nr:MAG: L,D-transpeptidase [Candidatus Angelobacter sp. Gp1-AA117]